MPEEVGPFDDDGLDVAGPPSGDLFGVEPPPVSATAAAPPDRTDVVTQLRQVVVSLPGLEPDPVEPACYPFDLQEYPRVVNGIVVPAVSVTTGWLDDVGIRRSVPPEFIPSSSVNTVRSTERSVLVYLRTGKPVILWVGESTVERDRALVAILSGLGRRR